MLLVFYRWVHLVVFQQLYRVRSYDESELSLTLVFRQATRTDKWLMKKSPSYISPIHHKISA
jgi:hypothetical protein